MYPFAVCLAQRKFKVGEYEFVGMNWIVDYPFRLKDRCRMDTDNYIFQPQLRKGLLSTPDGWQEIDDWFSFAKKLPTMEEELDGLMRPEDMTKGVYIIHMPPYGERLDITYRGGTGVGSKALYEFLKKHQPKLALHGHIHESPEVTGRWHAKIGRTICIQPGQLNGFTYVTIELPTMKFDRIKEQYVA